MENRAGIRRWPCLIVLNSSPRDRGAPITILLANGRERHWPEEGFAVSPRTDHVPRRYAASMDRPMWTCPKCGRQFLNANSWHSCIRRSSVEDHLADKPPGVADAYRKLESMVREVGTVEVESLKSRIGFKARATFGGATFTRTAMRVGFILARRIDDPRLRVESYGGRHGHSLQVTDPSQLTDELRDWLAEAYLLGTEGAGKPGSG